MPSVVVNPSFEKFSAKGKKLSKEYGGGGESGGDSSAGETRGKKSGGKRSFFQKAKRFGKQGRHGKGTEVDSETYTYFVQILELLRKDEFDTDDDRETFVENSLSHGEGNEVKLASNQLVSRVIESLLPLASEDRIYVFCEAFTPSLRVIVSDTFASHVLEKLLELTSSDKWRGSKKLVDWFEKTAMFVLNNFEDFTFDKYGSFVTKKVLECLSGHLDTPTELDIAGSKGSKSSILRLELYGDRIRNAKWEKILQDFGKRFAAWPQFNDLGQKPETSRLLQNVIQTVSRTEKSEAVVKELILRVLSTFPEGLEPENAAHRILEVAFSVASNKDFGIIFEKYYKGNLSKYIKEPCFITLQKIISAAPTDQYFITIFNELAPEVKTVIQEGRIVIIQNLASQCAKYNTKQKELWKLIKEAFKAVKTSSSDKENLLMALITTNPKTKTAALNQKTFSSTYFGSNTVQILMDFRAPVVSEVFECFNELNTPDVLKLALDPKGSFIISKMFKCWNVPHEQKEKVLHKLKDSLPELATTKFGSRIVDLIWLWADIPQKTTVATALSQRIPVLSANRYGRFLVETMGLQALARNKKEWTEHMAAQDKRKRDADKIAAQLGLAGAISPGNPSSSEESKSAKKGKKRKSETTQESVEPETVESSKDKKKSRKSGATLETTEPKISETPKGQKKSRKSEASQEATEPKTFETPKGKKKNRKSDVTLTEFTDQSEIVEAETPKKSKKKHRKSHVEAEVKDEPAEVKVEVENNVEGHVETPKKKKKTKKSEGVSEDLCANLPEIDETPKKRKKSKKSESVSEDVCANLPKIDETPKKKKKSRKSEKNNDNNDDGIIAAAETESNMTPKKKKKKDKSSMEF